MGIDAHLTISLKIVPNTLSELIFFCTTKTISALSVMVGYETTQSHLPKLFGKGSLVYRWGCVLRLHGQQWLAWVISFGIVFGIEAVKVT